MRLALLLCAAAAACGGGAPGPIPLETQTFAPALNVDLAHSTKTPNGVYYRDQVQGSGQPVTGCDTLTVDYTGWLADGTQFGTTVGTGVPFTFQLGNGEVILGFDEGLVGIRKGGTRQLVIPSSLGYGAVKRGNIPPNSNLVYVVTVQNTVGFTPLESDQYASQLKVDLASSTRTANGVYYRDTAAAPAGAATVANGQTLTVDYTGFLTNGNQFDSSASRGPLKFALGRGQVIQGWDEGLQGVKVGATRQLVIPSQLAYGCAGQGASIPPYANLVFSVNIKGAQ